MGVWCLNVVYLFVCLFVVFKFGVKKKGTAEEGVQVREGFVCVCVCV